jgi:hypothetical protein
MDQQKADSQLLVTEQVVSGRFHVSVTALTMTCGSQSGTQLEQIQEAGIYSLRRRAAGSQFIAKRCSA